MEFPIVVISIVALSIGLGGVCYGLGRYFERLAWNNLIREGKIPKPKGPNFTLHAE